MQTLFDIRGLTAVITGGSGQLGRAMAHGLADAGVRVAVVSLSMPGRLERWPRQSERMVDRPFWPTRRQGVWANQKTCLEDSCGL